MVQKSEIHVQFFHNIHFLCTFWGSFILLSLCVEIIYITIIPDTEIKEWNYVGIRLLYIIGIKLVSMWSQFILFKIYIVRLRTATKEITFKKQKYYERNLNVTLENTQCKIKQKEDQRNETWDI